MNGKILILCGTGSIGSYTTKELLDCGYSLDVTTKEYLVSDNPRLNYLKFNSYDVNLLKPLLDENKYDAIVDFSYYTPDVYTERLPLLASSTSQLIFLSSYRVYADLQHPITENAPQLLDVTKDKFLLEEEEYAMQKCRCERVINASQYKSRVTVVRPVISFYYKSLSLITTPAPTLIPRSLAGKKILLPLEGKDVVAGFGWSGNNGKLISRLVLNENALGEAFTIGTDEGLTWGEIAEYYKEYLGTQYTFTDKETYLKYGTTNSKSDLFGLDGDRLLDRSIDISKLLSATKLNRKDLLPTKDAIKSECERIKSAPDKLIKALSNEKSLLIDKQLDEYFSHH